MHMKLPTQAIGSFGLAFAAALLLAPQRAPAQDQPAHYHLARTFHIGEEGGWDYITSDPQKHLLYVTRSTHVQVIQESDGKVIADITGQQRNHGVAIVHSSGRGFISDGRDGSVVVFDLQNNQVLGKVKVDQDADGILYDPGSNSVLVVCGDAGKLFIFPPDIDLKGSAAPASVDLGGQPESFGVDGKGKAYVCLENKGEVAVVDTRAKKLLAHWPVAPNSTPVGMAVDAAHQRIFVACRKPQQCFVMSTPDGKILAKLPIGAGVDAAAFDDDHALASCRDGTLSVITATSADNFDDQTVQTRRGARTLAVDSKTHVIYLPTADFEPASAGQRRPRMKPDTFQILVVEP